jgi:hypothetical protein
MSISAQSRPKFVYQAYGARRFRLQAEMSIRSLLAHGVSGDNVLVFTDRPREFERLSIEPLHATPALVRNWAGPCGFHHRVKIELIGHVQLVFGGSVIYADSDTAWCGSPDALYSHLDSGNFVMHQCEQELSDSFHPEYRAALRLLEARGRLGALAGHVLEARMYNAGIVGLPHHSGQILQRVLTLCDDLSLMLPRRMELVEQLAFSYVLPRFGAIKTCPNQVHHYWRESFEVFQSLESMTPEEVERLSNDPAELERLFADAQRHRIGIAGQYRKRAARLAQSVARRKREIRAVVARWRRAA